MKTTAISFYSDIEGRTYYSDHASRLISECESFDIPYDIRNKPSLGTYQLNCLSKPHYILDMIEELNKPVLWLDIDTKIHKPLDIFDSFDSDVDMVLATANGMLSGIKASPLYFGNTDNAKKFLMAWHNSGRDILENNRGVFDHEPLFPLVQHFHDKINMKFVGPQYCIWPGHTNENTYITMGLADSETKKQALRDLGMDEQKIEWQSPGDKL